MFFHFLSFSFIFFVFVGCSKSDFFLGLNFVTISLDSSCVKNSFWGPSRVVTPLGPLFLFFLLFFSRFFLSFFLLFIFSFFLIFCSFLHFLIFHVFHFLFFHFFRRKSFFFSFFLYFFQIFFIAGVSIRV